MLKTKSLIANLSEIPREWVFEYYLKLSEKLTGQDVKITSVFNPLEKNPSMFVYYATAAGTYKFKDFSSQDKGGDGITLVQQMFQLTTRGEAAHKIINDYNQWLLNNKDDYDVREFKVRTKYKVASFTTRSWNTLDKKYWTQFHIGSSILEYYNVKPLESYKMQKQDQGEEVQELVIKGQFIYGYFRNDGSLYKIYQPKVTNNKFIKVKEYIQGTDQLTFKPKNLIICSSLKDMMAMKKLFGSQYMEFIAPDSENTLISPHVIAAYQNKYDNVITLFDNDIPGITAMQKYKDRFDLPYIHLDMEKDVSDAIKEHGLCEVREALLPLLREIILKPESAT